MGLLFWLSGKARIVAEHSERELHLIKMAIGGSNVSHCDVVARKQGRPPKSRICGIGMSRNRGPLRPGLACRCLAGSSAEENSVRFLKRWKEDSELQGA